LRPSILFQRFELKLRMLAKGMGVSADTRIIEQLNALLKCVSDIASRDTELSKKLHFSVKRKSDVHQNRISKVFTYKGPDSATVDLLKITSHGPRLQPRSGSAAACNSGPPRHTPGSSIDSFVLPSTMFEVVDRADRRKTSQSPSTTRATMEHGHSTNSLGLSTT
jgi:hypothetical protein